MKKHLKTILLLSGIIGTTHGSVQIISDENILRSVVSERQAHATRSALGTVEPNLTQVLSLAYDECTPSRSTNPHPLLLIQVIDRIAALNKSIHQLSQEVKVFGRLMNLVHGSGSEASEQIETSYHCIIQKCTLRL